MVQPSKSDPALWTLEERWHIFMDNVKDYAIFTLDPEGKIATWNEGAQWLATEVVGWNHLNQPTTALTDDSFSASSIMA